MITGYSTSGDTHDFFCYDAAGSVWNGLAFVVWNDVNFVAYRVATTEVGTSGRFTGTEPVGTVRYELRVQAATLAASYVVYEERLTIPRVTLTDTTTTLTSFGTLIADVKAALIGLFRLLARKDTAVAADHAADLALINVNVASGAGAFDNTTDALEAVSDNSGGVVDWTAVEQAQIRYRLAIDGVKTQPASDTPPPIVVTPPVDATKTAAVLVAYDLDSTVVGAKFYFVLIEGAGSTGYSYDQSEYQVTSDANGLVVAELYKGALYRGRRESGDWVKFRAAVTDISELPEILGKPLIS